MVYREQTAARAGNARSGTELEKELAEVIKSLEETAQEIEKLTWDNQFERKDSKC